MLGFIADFSDSLLLALFAWPFVAMLLTLPVMALQYRLYNKVLWRRVLWVYLFMLYGLGLITFTLYPLPDNPAQFCAAYALTPQLHPFSFINDIATDGLRAVLQIVMNLVFFLPLGIFARLFFHWKCTTAILVALLVSLGIETAQLTGAFGYYPCSYRLFDVDDLFFNTLGATVGYLLATLLPRRNIEKAEQGAITTHPGLLRRFITFSIDILITAFLWLIIALALYFGIDKDAAMAWREAIFFILILLLQFGVPYLFGGQTIGGRITRTSLDDQPRKVPRRTAYYLLRLGFMCSIIFTPNWVGALLVLAIFVTWRVWKRLPYRVL